MRPWRRLGPSSFPSPNGFVASPFVLFHIFIDVLIRQNSRVLVGPPHESVLCVPGVLVFGPFVAVIITPYIDTDKI